MDSKQERDRGVYSRTIYKGLAHCKQPTCRAKGKKNFVVFTTKSRDPLKKHYERLHRACYPQLNVALAGILKRSTSSEAEHPDYSKKRQLSMQVHYTTSP
jgi:hypothetical protein